MEGLLNGYVIDPKEQTMTWRGFSESKMKNVIECDLLELVYLPDENRVIVLDEEALLKNNQCYWKYGDMNNVLNNAFAGVGIILGFDFNKGTFVDVCPDLPKRSAERSKAQEIIKSIKDTYAEVEDKVSFVKDKDYKEEPVIQFVSMENL